MIAIVYLAAATGGVLLKKVFLQFHEIHKETLLKQLY